LKHFILNNHIDPGIILTQQLLYFIKEERMDIEAISGPRIYDGPKSTADTEEVLLIEPKHPLISTNTLGPYEDFLKWKKPAYKVTISPGARQRYSELINAGELTL
jgi:hypothetical protein